MALSVEAAELVEHFQWATPEESLDLAPGKRAEVADEIADVLIYLTELADVLGIDPIAAAREKIVKNAAKYPAAPIIDFCPKHPMSHFKHHVFFCTNQRAAGEACCNNHGASDMRAYAKDKVKALGDKVPGKVRINAAGCLDRCEQGPVLVIYPEAVWYTYVDKEDIDEIIDQHLVNGRVVERLKI
jgi:(2Fe-2S) ferredoxin